jgi:diguanylate cyclase (GGDEF)-like protein
MSQLRFLINLTEQSTRDALTQALTRRFGEEMLDIQLAIAERSGAPLAVMFFDLDKFKAVNDEFGHEEGDALLHRAAQSIRKTLRRQDILIRWGGEEFLAVLPQADPAKVERVVTRIAKAGIGLLPDGRQQTASIGIAERMNDNAGDWKNLVKLADERMYSAKRAGRNRYVGAVGHPVPFILGATAVNPTSAPRHAAADTASDTLSWAADYSI